MAQKTPPTRMYYGNALAHQPSKQKTRSRTSKIALVGFMSLVSCLSAAGMQYQTELATIAEAPYTPVSIAYANPLEMTAPVPVRLEYSLPSIPVKPRSRFANIPYGELLEQKAHKYELDPTLTVAVAIVESHLNHKAESHVGAKGIMQVTPDTAQKIRSKKGVIRSHCDEYGFNVPTNNLEHPDTNTELGSCYLSYLLDRYNGFTKLALAAYNAGPANVDKYKGVPPFTETRNFIQRVNTVRKGLSDPTSYEAKQLKIASR